MSKKTTYSCDICSKEFEDYCINRFKRIFYESYKIGWWKDRFDICDECLDKIREAVKAGGKE